MIGLFLKQQDALPGAPQGCCFELKSIEQCTQRRCFSIRQHADGFFHSDIEWQLQSILQRQESHSIAHFFWEAFQLPPECLLGQAFRE
jgi:hypothetical protein